MSKLSVRVILAVVVSLGVIFAIYTSVQGASAMIGTRSVSGAMVNLNHDRFTVAELQVYNTQLDAYNNSFNDRGEGHGCHFEGAPNPDD